MARRDYSGNAVPTTLTAELTASGLVASIQEADGWPSGGGSGKFFVIINFGQSNEEHALVTSRTGTTLTFADVSDRGADNTTAAIHTAGSTIHHGITAVDVDESNDHINNPARHDHTQYLRTTEHDVEARHQFGGALGTPGTPAKVGTVEGPGDGGDPARDNHVHELGDGSIDSSAQFAAGVVGTAALAANAVTTAKIPDDAITGPKIAPDAVGSSEIAPTAVGSSELADDAVIAGKIADGAIDSTLTFVAGIVSANALAAGSVVESKIGAEAVSQAKVKVEAPTSYAPTIGGLTGGSNTVTGTYFKFGGLVIGIVEVVIGAGGNINDVITMSTPTTCRNSGNNWFAAIRALSGVNGATGMGVIEKNTNFATNFRTIGVGVWDGTSPWNWAPGDVMLGVIVYSSAT